MMMKILVLLFLFAFSISFAEETLSINAVGDIMTGTLFPERRIPPENGASIFRFVREILTNENPGIIMGNFEGCATLTTNLAKTIVKGRKYAFRMSPDSINYLKEAGFNYMNLANNHALDFGWTGYKDTKKYLNQAGIANAGMKGEAGRLTINGKSVVILPFSWFDWSYNVHEKKLSSEVIAQAKASNDIVIVFFHGGAEGDQAVHVKNADESFYSEKRGNLVKFSHQAIDSGADLVIGSGPHVVRAMELYKGKLIAYSLGNFATYSMATAGLKKIGLVLNVKLDENGDFVKGKIMPTRQFEGSEYNGIPKPDDKNTAVDLIRKLCREDFPDSPLSIETNGDITIKKAVQ